MRRLPRATAAALLVAGVGSAGAASADATEAIARGAALAASRTQGLCVLCHALPGLPDSQRGTLAPPLHGVGARLDAPALRERLLAPQRFNPDSVMPAYGDTGGLQRVAPAWQGRPLLQPAQIDDLVAWLASLR
jgi:L-cysteine S-thiosulfotransferase